MSFTSKNLHVSRNCPLPLQLFSNFTPWLQAKKAASMIQSWWAVCLANKLRAARWHGSDFVVSLISILNASNIHTKTAGFLGSFKHKNSTVMPRCQCQHKLSLECEQQPRILFFFSPPHIIISNKSSSGKLNHSCRCAIWWNLLEPHKCN